MEKSSYKFYEQEMHTACAKKYGRVKNVLIKVKLTIKIKLLTEKVDNILKRCNTICKLWIIAITCLIILINFSK